MKKEYAVLGRWDFVLMRKKKFYKTWQETERSGSVLTEKRTLRAC